MFIICKERTLTASYYFSIFDLSVKRCFINSWSTQNIQSTLSSQSCDSEFNMCGKANHKIQSLSQPQQAYKVTYKDRTQADTNASPLAGRCPPPRQADTPPGRQPPRQTPWADTPSPCHQQTATAADGTHPTGIRPCLCFLSGLCISRWHVQAFWTAQAGQWCANFYI